MVFRCSLQLYCVFDEFFQLVFSCFNVFNVFFSGSQVDLKCWKSLQFVLGCFMLFSLI